MDNPIRPLSRAEVRQLDRQAAETLAVPTMLLMESAGRGASCWLAELVGIKPPQAGGYPCSLSKVLGASNASRQPSRPRVLILCGPGNNGGDGGVVARYLNGWGFPVRVVWFARRNQLRGDAALQWTILEKSSIDQFAWYDRYPAGGEIELESLATMMSDADWLVDGLLGTGLSRPVEDPLFSVITAMNRSGKPILALDLPSGLDADTGQPLGVAVSATATATFVAPKIGFSSPQAAQYTGKVAVIDIGLPGILLRPFREQ